MSQPKLKLTEGRRARIVEILSPLGDGVSIYRKADLVSRGLGEPCTQGEALSLLAQFRKGKKGKYRHRRKSRAEREHERFLKMKAQRKDAY